MGVLTLVIAEKGKERDVGKALLSFWLKVLTLTYMPINARRAVRTYVRDIALLFGSCY